MIRLLFAASLALSLAACGGPAPQANVSNLRLVSENQEYPVVTGYLVNSGEVPISSADVFVTLYDRDNRPMEDVSIQVRTVSVGDSSRFERQLDLRPSGAKVKLVSAN